jgi:hypothetical protein
MGERLAEAIERMGQMLRCTDDALSHLNCTEFQPIVEVLVLTGHLAAARDVVLGHSAGDDDIWDHHHALYEVERREDGSSRGHLLNGFIREIQTGEPIMKWRNVFGERADSMDYFTQDARDYHARQLAKAYRQDVLSFVWHAAHVNGDSSEGWKLDAVVVYVPD